MCDLNVWNIAWLFVFQYDKTLPYVFVEGSLDILLDLMQIYREKGVIFNRTCTLVGILGIDNHRRMVNFLHFYFSYIIITIYMVSDLHIDKLTNILSLLLLFPLWFLNLVHQSLIYFKNQTYFCLSLHKIEKLQNFQPSNKMLFTIFLQVMLSQPRVKERIQSLYNLSARKYQLQENQQMRQAKLNASKMFNSTLPIRGTPHKPRKIRPAWVLHRDSLHNIDNPMQAINFVMDNLHIRPK